MGKVRQANMELLRIVAMFMILVIHANMISLIRPTSVDFESNPLAVFIRYFIESFGIVGVDIFVMISGWFLINTRAKSFLSLSFQILLLWGGGFCILLLLGKTDFSIKNILEVIAFTKWDWFIKSYVVLMIIAPVLNTFVKYSTEKQQRLVILGFFAFSSTYGWFGGANRFFVYGYGPLLFMGIYLLAQYAHQALSEDSIPISVRRLFCLEKKYDIMIFAGCAILNTLIAVGGLIVSARIYNVVYAYTNPITIIGALYLLLFFSKLDVKSNKIVSMLATGSFAVYLLHSQVDLRPVFSSGVQYIYNSHNGVGCILLVFVYLVLVYSISVIIDLLRLWLWNILCKKNNIE